MRPLSRGAGIEWCRFGRPRRSFSGRVFQPRRGRHRFGRTVLSVTLPTYLCNNYQINIKYIQHNNIFSNYYPQHKNYVLNTAIFEIL